MSRLSAPIITACLIAGGVLAVAVVARPLVTAQGPAFPLNPLGLKCSPYGEVLACGMQAPIDTYFHAGQADHDHDCGADCDHDHAGENAPAAVAQAAAPTTLRERCTEFLSGLDKAGSVRTNPKPASPALKFYLRRQAEDKLRLAYQLDPAHYGNFNSYYFFLTHHELGTRPELTASAVDLAQQTITYCLERDDDPRAALTAAAAAQSVLEHMINDQRAGKREISVEQMRQALGLIDHCLARHLEISARWDASGNWNLLSAARRGEVRERLQFISKIREAQGVVVDNLANSAAPHQATR